MVHIIFNLSILEYFIDFGNKIADSLVSLGLIFPLLVLVVSAESKFHIFSFACTFSVVGMR